MQGTAGGPEADPVDRYGVREERLLTGATVITAVRTIASVVLAAMAAHQQSLTLLVVALVVYWVGDMLDGFYARVRDCETRIGAVLDIMCDRFNAAAFYIGLAWLQPDLSPAIFVYLAEFMVDRLLPVDRVPRLADPQPQLLLRRRPHHLAVELVQARQGGQQRALRGAAARHRLDVGGARDRHRAAGPQVRVAAPPRADRPAGTGRRGLMLFWSVMGASIASALLPLINIEAILVVSVSQAPGQMWGLLVAATIGQMLGKILWYWGGMHVERAPWVHRQLEKPKARASLDKWHERAEGRPWFTAGLLFVSASTGIPPYAVTAVLAGTLRVPFWIFMLTGLAGRGLRFWAVVTGTSSLVHLF